MELLVVMAPVCSDVQGVSSEEADVKEINGSVDSVICKGTAFLKRVMESFIHLIQLISSIRLRFI